MIAETIMVAVAALTMVAFGDGARKDGSFRPPAVPLVSVDPHFSLWSAADRLYDADTSFWTGHPQSFSILLEADGVTYRLCGRGTSSFLNDLPTLPQTECRAGATVTTYRFRKGSLCAEVSFTTLRIADDLDGHMAHNANLSIKSAMAFASYALMVSCDRARDEIYPSEGSNMVSPRLEVSLVGAGGEMTPFLVGVAAVLSETASICGVMVPYPRLPRRKEVASSAKGGGSLIGSKYEPARQYG